MSTNEEADGRLESDDVGTTPCVSHTGCFFPSERRRRRQHQLQEQRRRLAAGAAGARGMTLEASMEGVRSALMRPGPETLSPRRGRRRKKGRGEDDDAQTRSIAASCAASPACLLQQHASLPPDDKRPGGRSTTQAAPRPCSRPCTVFFWPDATLGRISTARRSTSQQLPFSRYLVIRRLSRSARPVAEDGVGSDVQQLTSSRRRTIQLNSTVHPFCSNLPLASASACNCAWFVRRFQSPSFVLLFCCERHAQPVQGYAASLARSKLPRIDAKQPRSVCQCPNIRRCDPKTDRQRQRRRRQS